MVKGWFEEWRLIGTKNIRASGRGAEMRDLDFLDEYDASTNRQFSLARTKSTLPVRLGHQNKCGEKMCCLLLFVAKETADATAVRDNTLKHYWPTFFAKNITNPFLY